MPSERGRTPSWRGKMRVSPNEPEGAAAQLAGVGGRAASRRRGEQAFAGRARPRGPRGRSEVPVAGPLAQWQTTSNGLIS